MLFLTSCEEGGPRTIPRDTLSQIYAEMLLTDQWITHTSGIKAIADTSKVYEPILRKYGYTLEDYQHTVNEYLEQPNRFAKIFEKTEEILDKQLIEANAQKEYEDFVDDVHKSVKDAAVPIDTTRLYPISKKEFFNIQYDPEYRIDSIVFEADSLGINYSVKVLKKIGPIIDSTTLHLDAKNLQKELLGGKSIEDVFPAAADKDSKSVIRKAELKELSLAKEKK